MKNTIIFFIFILLLYSCKKNRENDIQKPGIFALSRLENYNSTYKSANFQELINVKKTSSLDQYSFDLGEIKTSKEFYFLLLNVGDLPIFDIQLSSDNPNFKISPTKISSLSSTNNISDLDNDQILPIITIGIEHGKRIDGNGYGDLLNMGINNSIITIVGKTIQDEDTLSISCSSSIVVDAKVMDIIFYVDNNEINLFNPSGSLTTSIKGLGTLPYYYVDYINKPIKITNSGNIPITIEILGNNIDTVNLAPSLSVDSLIVEGKYMVFTIANTTSSGHHAIFKLNSQGTAVKNDKLRLLSDGNAYFSVFCWDFPGLPTEQ